MPPRTVALLREWLAAAVGSDPDAWLFPSEARDAPIWRENLLRRHIQLPLEKVGLGWVDFRVMRRTNASLGHDAKVDPRVSADQRGHGSIVFGLAPCQGRPRLLGCFGLHE